MLLRLLLLVALPATVLCYSAADNYRSQTLRYLNTYVKPCILKKRNCPDDGSWSFPVLKQTVRQLISFSLPEECDCDTSQSDCVRTCYYAYVQKQLQSSVDAGYVNITDSAVQEQLELYRTCLLEDKRCEALGGGLNLAQITQQIEILKKFYTLPDECGCDLTKERCIRVCYYSYVRDTALAQAPSKKRRNV